MKIIESIRRIGCVNRTQRSDTVIRRLGGDGALGSTLVMCVAKQARIASVLEVEKLMVPNDNGDVEIRNTVYPMPCSASFVKKLS